MTPDLTPPRSPSAASFRSMTIPSLSPPPSPSSSRPRSALMTGITSSSPLASSSRPRPRKDIFKPKFPLDPFHGHSAAALGEPWFLKIDAVLNAISLHRQNVIFVLGVPSLAELSPLLQSQRLERSLVILATHQPPDIPGIVYPSVRILRLTTPIALEEAGAVRFVNVLEWAERVARMWRKHGGHGVVEWLEERDNNGDLMPPSVFRRGTQSASASPRSSTIHLSGGSSTTLSTPSSRPPSMIGTLFSRQSPTPIPASDPSQRPFDVMVNFMPQNVSDKALLKNSILVTTISRPFLKSPVHGPSPPTLRSRTTSSSSSTRLTRPQSIFSAFSRSTSSVYLPPTPPYQSGDSLPLMSLAPPGKALLIHLLPLPPRGEHPAARRKLVDSMETFLLSFSSQLTALPSMSPSSGKGAALGTANQETDQARPYVMHASTFCDAVSCDPALGAPDVGEWCVADIVLSGALDPDVPSSLSVAPAAVPILAGAGSGRKSRRAWIATAADLVILPSSEDPTSGPSMSISPRAESGSLQSSASSPSPSSPLPSRWINRGARSSSAPLLTADWSPAQLGGRPMSHHSASMSHRSQLSHLESKDGAREFRSGSNLRTPTPPVMTRSSTTASSSGPPTPPHSSEDGDPPLDAIEETSPDTAPRPSMDVSAISASTVDLSSMAGESSKGSKASVKVAKWKFWRRRVGANVPSAAVAA